MATQRYGVKVVLVRLYTSKNGSQKDMIVEESSRLGLDYNVAMGIYDAAGRQLKRGDSALEADVAFGPGPQGGGPRETT